MEAETKHYVADMNEPEMVQEEEQPLPTKKRTCYKPGRDAPKSELLAIHKLKMEMKKQRRAKQEPTGYGLPIRNNRSKKWDEDGSQSDSAE